MSDTTENGMPIALIVTFVVVLAGMGLAAKFTVGGFLNERATYASLRTQINDIQYKRDQLTLAQASAQNVDNDVAHIKKAFVSQNNILNALVPLEQEAASEGVTEYKVTAAQDLPSANAKSSPALKGTTLRIEGRGTLEALFTFARTLQSLPYFLRIESLQLQQTGLSSGQAVPAFGNVPLQTAIIVKFFSLP